MNQVLQGNFYNPSAGNLTPKGVIEEIIRYISEKPDKSYDIVVGCDSSSDKDPLFPIAVVVLRKGEGGRFFLRKIHYGEQERKRFQNWKMRILQEVMLSCEFALFLREELEQRIKELENFDYEFKYIHADVGETGDTRNMIKEVTGLIKGNGFEPVIKPGSYVASGVADKFC